jgi:cellobiose-specific phosphotransferase system component IIA
MQSDLQIQAERLQYKIQNEAEKTLSQIENTILRPIARTAYSCVVDCYDKASTTGSKELLQSCSNNCQKVHESVNSLIGREINEYQNRVNRSMMQCQDEVSGLMTHDMMENDRKRKKMEHKVLNCLEKAVKDHVKQLEPMKCRIADSVKEIEKRSG